MIIYNWKAEFSGDQKEMVKVYKQVNNTLSNLKDRDILSDIVLIAEMANALDRYQNILNEMQKEAANE